MDKKMLEEWEERGRIRKEGAGKKRGQFQRT